MAFEADQVETVTVDSYGTLVDPKSIRATLSTYVENPEVISNLWFSRSLMNKLVSNSLGIYEPFDILSRDGLNYALEYHNIQLNDGEKEDILTSYNELEVYEGVQSGINSIYDSGYEIYVVSNGTPEMLDTLVDHTGIKDSVADTISSSEIETYKPNARIYRHAAGRTGTPIDQIVHVSGPFFDVLGAMYAGMQGAWVNYGNGPRDNFAGAPDLEINSFDELAKILSN